MKVKVLFASLLAAGLLSSCEDMFTNNKPDGSNPYITVNSPKLNHSFTQANGVAISLTVVDKDEIAELNIKISDTKGEPPILDITRTYSETVAVIDTVVAANVIQPGSYNMFIIATDKRKNVEGKIIPFTIIN